jgi:hypothetical protein
MGALLTIKVKALLGKIDVVSTKPGFGHLQILWGVDIQE